MKVGTSSQPQSTATMSPVFADELLIVCLCAQWCGTCRDYHPGFEAMAAEFPAARFHWLDIEEQADELGDLDIENFPTLLIRQHDQVLFYGTMLPHLGHLRRLIETLAAQTPEERRSFAQSTPERMVWQDDTDLAHLGRLLSHE